MVAWQDVNTGYISIQILVVNEFNILLLSNVCVTIFIYSKKKNYLAVVFLFGPVS